MSERYLIYVDILGFEDSPEKLSKESGFYENMIREKFFSDAVRKKIREMKKEKIQVFKGISKIEGSDDYVLVVDDIQTAFEAIGKLTTIKIPHRDYKYVPLEIGIDTEEIDELLQVELINRSEIIRFLKNDIINPYRRYYKKEHGDTMKESYVLFSERFFESLEPLDKKFCRRILLEEKAFFVADVKKIQQRCRIFRFLEKIGYPNSELYGRIDEIYIPPIEYEEIERTLRKKRIVFITGTPEYGKTYTAVKLMWEYYSKGYEPRWVKGGEQIERALVREKLEDIGAQLKPKHILYFEDPFGKTRYERRESLERKIGTIVNNVKQVEDVYVVITSREEVFKEFGKEKLSLNDIKKFEKTLNLKRPSYDYDQRIEMLLMWAESKNCEWLNDEYLVGLVSERVSYWDMLPTPLSIREFVIATVNTYTEDQLITELKEKSKETAMAFSREIKNTSDDKILFLSFLFISEEFEVDFIRRMYGKLVKRLDIKDAWEFDRILNWFKDDKINILHEYIEFSHPSYSEALKYLLVEDGYITRINRDIFSRILFNLSKYFEARPHVADTIARNFDNLPGDVRDKLLLILSKYDSVVVDIAKTMNEHFATLSEKTREELLLRLSEKRKTASIVAEIVKEHFATLSEKTREELLLRLSEKDLIAKSVAWAVAKNFDNLPGDVRDKLLLTLSGKEGAAWELAKFIEKHFDTLSEKQEMNYC